MMAEFTRFRDGGECTNNIYVQIDSWTPQKDGMKVGKRCANYLQAKNRRKKG